MSNSQFPSFFPLSFSLHRGANCSVPSFLTERLLVWIKAHIVASVPNLRLPKQEHTHMDLQTDTHTHTVLNNHQTTFYKPLALSTLMVVNLKMRCQMWFWTPLAFSDHFLKAYWPPWNAKNYKKNSSSISSRFPCSGGYSKCKLSGTFWSIMIDQAHELSHHNNKTGCCC